MKNLDLGLRELIIGHRSIRGAEIHGTFLNLLNAASRTNRLVVNLNSGVLRMVDVKPLRVNWIREGGTRGVQQDLLCASGESEAENERQKQRGLLHSFHLSPQCG